MISHSRLDSTITARTAHHPEDLKSLVASIENELRELTERRAGIVRRIAAVKKTVSRIANLYGHEVLGSELEGLLSIRSSGARQLHYGLTDLCRRLLNTERPHGLTVKALLARAREQFPDRLSIHRHPETSLRVVLRRLVEYGEAVEIVLETGVKAWRAPARTTWEDAVGSEGLQGERARQSATLPNLSG